MSHTNHYHFQSSGRLMRIGAIASIIVAIVLVIAKFYALLQTGSVSILSSLIDSVLDSGMSLVSLLAIRYSLLPPDSEHRFGHTGAEDVAAMMQAAFITASALFIGIEAIGRISSPEVIENSTTGIGVMLFSIILTLALVMLQKYVVAKTSSTTIQADSLHYVGDLLANIAVIVAIILSSYFGWKYADPIFALAIACYILYGAWKIGNTAFNKLIDREFEEEEVEHLRNTILNFPDVLGIHDLKTRYSGIKPFIQLHVEMDKNLSFSEAHAVADKLEKKLVEIYEGGEVIIHEDPV